MGRGRRSLPSATPPAHHAVQSSTEFETDEDAKYFKRDLLAYVFFSKLLLQERGFSVSTLLAAEIALFKQTCEAETRTIKQELIRSGLMSQEESVVGGGVAPAGQKGNKDDRGKGGEGPARSDNLAFLFLDDEDRDHIATTSLLREQKRLFEEAVLPRLKKEKINKLQIGLAPPGVPPPYGNLLAHDDFDSPEHALFLTPRVEVVTWNPMRHLRQIARRVLEALDSHREILFQTHFFPDDDYTCEKVWSGRIPAILKILLLELFHLLATWYALRYALDDAIYSRMVEKVIHSGLISDFDNTALLTVAAETTSRSSDVVSAATVSRARIAPSASPREEMISFFPSVDVLVPAENTVLVENRPPPTTTRTSEVPPAPPTAPAKKTLFDLLDIPHLAGKYEHSIALLNKLPAERPWFRSSGVFHHVESFPIQGPAAAPIDPWRDVVELLVEVRTQMRLEAEVVAPANFLFLRGKEKKDFFLQSMDDMLPLLICLLLKSREVKRPMWFVRMADDYFTGHQKVGNEMAAHTMWLFDMALSSVSAEGVVLRVSHK